LEVLMVTLTDLQKVPLTISPVDAVGNPALVEGIPVWTSSNEAVLTVIPAEDGLSAVATTVGPLGVAQVTVTADADLGEGVTMIAGTEDFTVLASQAVSMGITTGVPEVK
jgi:hypothetical protein